MKKNDLIKKLQEIEGNPEIKYWNGFVEDWMNVELVESELVKEAEEFIYFNLIAEWQRDNKSNDVPLDVKAELKELAKKYFKESEWDFANPYISEEKDFKRWYGKNRKKIILINGKKRGKKTYDRLGSIEY